jgi:serine protease Do
MKRMSVYVALLTTGTFLGGFAAHSFLQGQPVVAPPAVVKELTSYRDVVKQVLPAVVSIEARKKPVKGRRAPDFDPAIPEEIRKYFEGMQPQFGEDGPSPRQGFGSGFIVDPRGIVLTNNHVVEGADELIVQLKDGRKITSKDFKADPKSDLAIVKLNVAGKLPYLELGDSDSMEIGDRVLAVGAPFGLVGSVTHGIISGKGRSLKMNMYEDFLQTDAAINPGNSGGPLISLDGKVIAINAAIKSRSGGFQGVGLAIASNLARDVMKKLEKDGVVKRGYLGVQIQDVIDEALAEKLGLPKGQKGVIITRVFEDGPASKGGIKEGDVVTQIAGHAVVDGRDVQRIVADLPLGKPVKVVLFRDGQSRTVDLTIEEQPDQIGGPVKSPKPKETERDESGAVNLDKAGIAAADLTPELAARLGYGENTRGAMILRVEPDSPAGAAELSRGMLITRVDRTPVASAADLKKAVENASLSKGMLLQVQTPKGGTTFVLLKSSAAGQ